MDYHERKKAYKEVKNPQELLDFMNRYIKYGFYGTDNRIYENSTPESALELANSLPNQYSLPKIVEIFEHGYGLCWDQVELERDWFCRHNYEFKTFFIWFLLEYENNYFTHSYLVYKDKNNGKYYYFEHSDSDNRGIHEFDSYKEAIEYQKENQIAINSLCGNPMDDEILRHLTIFEYTKPPVGVNMDEYLDYIIESKVVYKDNNYKL